jgi:hypothetical protein
MQICILPGIEELGNVLVLGYFYVKGWFRGLDASWKPSIVDRITGNSYTPWPAAHLRFPLCARPRASKKLSAPWKDREQSALLFACADGLSLAAVAAILPLPDVSIIPRLFIFLKVKIFRFSPTLPGEGLSCPISKNLGTTQTAGLYPRLGIGSKSPGAAKPSSSWLSMKRTPQSRFGPRSSLCMRLSTKSSR